MRDTRFIFIEGIIGAGKTTTAWVLAEQIRRHGRAARFMAEGPTVDEPAHPLRVATNFPHPNGIWLDLGLEEYIEQSLGLWRAFAEDTQHYVTVTVCDGLLFHGNMTDLLLMNAGHPVLRRYVTAVLESIRALAPSVIYFYHTDVAAALRAVCARRGSAWEAYQVGWKVGSPYGAARSLQGFDGLVALYRDYRAICDDLFAEFTVPKLAIHRDEDWAAHYRAIRSFLDLPPAAITLPL